MTSAVAVPLGLAALYEVGARVSERKTLTMALIARAVTTVVAGLAFNA